MQASFFTAETTHYIQPNKMSFSRQLITEEPISHFLPTGQCVVMGRFSQQTVIYSGKVELSMQRSLFFSRDPNHKGTINSWQPFATSSRFFISVTKSFLKSGALESYLRVKTGRIVPPCLTKTLQIMK